MNILFLFVSLPNLNDKNSLFTSLIHEFKEQGHNVLVSAKDYRQEQKSEVVIENDINVLRVKSHQFTRVSNPIKKALAYQEYVIKQRYLVIKHFGKEKIDVVFSHSLPPELAWVISGIKCHFGCKFYLLQTDFTWQDAVAFGYFRKNSPVCWYYRFWEKRMFKQADYIGCPTKGNIDYILKFYPNIEKEKFQLVPFWQKAIQSNDVLDAKANDELLKNKFVVVYGGSIGAAQRIEHILELANETREISDIVYLILGRGAYLPVLKGMAKKQQLTNVVFKEFLPRDEYMQLLASCDVGMIILNEKMATPNFPSKSLAYFNMKVPVLAALDYSTDFGHFLMNNEIGLWAYSNEIKELKKKLMMYYEDRKFFADTKEKAYNYYINNLQPEHAYKTIIKIIQK